MVVVGLVPLSGSPIVNSRCDEYELDSGNFVSSELDMLSAMRLRWQEVLVPQDLYSHAQLQCAHPPTLARKPEIIRTQHLPSPSQKPYLQLSRRNARAKQCSWSNCELRNTMHR